MTPEDVEREEREQRERWAEEQRRRVAFRRYCISVNSGSYATSARATNDPGEFTPAYCRGRDAANTAAVNRDEDVEQPARDTRTLHRRLADAEQAMSPWPYKDGYP